MSRIKWNSEKIFHRLLTNKTKKTYWDNISELRKRPCAEVYNKAANLLNSNIDNEKIIGIDVLAQLGSKKRFNQKKSLNQYFKLLKHDQSSSVLNSILIAISHNNKKLSKKRIAQLLEYKNHENSEVRFGLVNSLSGINDESAIQVLIELSSDKHPSIRDWATFSIGTQIEVNSTNISKALWNRIDDNDKNTRLEAIFGLAKRKDQRIKSILIEELNKIDEHGSIILESIEYLNDFEFVSLLEKQIEINKKSNSVNELWLTNTIKKLKTTHNKVQNVDSRHL